MNLKITTTGIRGRFNLHNPTERLTKSMTSIGYLSLKLYNSFSLHIRELNINSFKKEIKNKLIEQAGYNIENFVFV